MTNHQQTNSMRIVTWALAILAGLAAVVACGSKKSNQKVLVLYYSQTTNTRAVAEEIANRLGADIREIVPVTPYDGDFQATIQRCLQEQAAGTKPEIQPLDVNLDDYGTIFLGFPVWFGTYAPPIAAWLDGVDLSGKKIVPFCTFGSGGLDTSVRDLAEKEPGAEILPGYGVRAARMAAVPKEIDRFLKENSFIGGEFTPLEAFPEQHPVSEEESALFDTAVGSYPMISAQAVSVASRAIDGGTEYRFTALEKSRGEAGPDAPSVSPREMTIYVVDTEDEEPVFTQVVR